MRPLAEEEEFPPKLLDCPVFEEIAWPDTFINAGEVLRFDYASLLHSSEDGEYEGFRHRFATGVGVLLPSDHPLAAELASDHPAESGIRLPDPYEPVHMGFAHRLYFVARDGRQVILANPGLGVDETDAEESFQVADLPASSFAWDPEGRMLLALSPDGEVHFVLSGGLLRLSGDAMIVG